jgi:hypothetical protein
MHAPHVAGHRRRVLVIPRQVVHRKPTGAQVTSSSSYDDWPQPKFPQNATLAPGDCLIGRVWAAMVHDLDHCGADNAHGPKACTRAGGNRPAGPSPGYGLADIFPSHNGCVRGPPRTARVRVIIG